MFFFRITNFIAYFRCFNTGIKQFIALFYDDFIIEKSDKLLYSGVKAVYRSFL